MISRELFKSAYEGVCFAFSREPKQNQCEFFYSQLCHFSDEDMKVGIPLLANATKLPNLNDWKVALSDARKRNNHSNTMSSFGKCPSCGAATIQRRFPDDELYEACLLCYWKDRIYTREEWLILHGLEKFKDDPVGLSKEMTNRGMNVQSQT